VVNAQGQRDVAITSDLLLADFGGPAAGPDLLTTARDPITTQVAAMVVVRTSLTTATRQFVANPAGGGICSYTTLQLDGAGAEELVAGCFTALGAAVFLARPQGMGASLTFAPWQQVTTLAQPCTPLSVPSPPGDARRYLVCDDQLLVLSAVNNAVSLATHRLGAPAVWGIFAFLRGQPEPELVTDDANEPPTQLRVHAWHGTTWVEQSRIPAASCLPLAPFVTTPGQPPDVLIGPEFETRISFLVSDGGVLF
jgi:hypothetical protein